MRDLHQTFYVAFSVMAFTLLFGCREKSSSDSMEVRHPNIVYILADDLGYGDLGCYGQQHFTTPNIDKLAEQGMRFTQHYSGATVCAPSRSALMTGLHTGHTPVRGNKEVQPEGQWPLPAASFTLAEMLKAAGYRTGIFGKWGLGYPGSEGAPNSQGFDEFFGYNCQRMAHNYYPFHLWHNDRKIMLDENEGQLTGIYAPAMIHQEALKFIDKNRDTTFFLFYASPLPHAELLAPDDYIAKYRDKFLPEKGYKGVDKGEGFRMGSYGSQPESHAAFVAMINYLDDQVGELVQKLQDLGIADNTIVIFTSDNGPHMEGGADPDYFDSNGPLRGYKRDLYEGGIRVPMIACWPGKIRQGSASEHISAFWDVMPTVAELTGKPIPNGIDGISFLPTLLGSGDQETHDYLYWEFHERGGRVAIRKDNWKLIRYEVNNEPQGRYQLYDLDMDKGEAHDLAVENQAKVTELARSLESARTESDIFRFGSVAFDAGKK